MRKNILLLTDVYKLGHMNQYNPDVVNIYSYLEARKPNIDTVFFGLQYLLKEYLENYVVTHEDVNEVIKYRNMILGSTPKEIEDKYRALADLGYLPIKIKAIKEGSIINSKNLLLSITNTVDGFHWLVGYLESFLLKLWNTNTVASCSLKYRRLVESYAETTCDNKEHIPFQVHDFGYRGVSSEETAAMSGAAHLLAFLGSDTIPAVKLLDKYYGSNNIIGCSVPASEHSVMCSFGKENELNAFKHMLDTHPLGIVSIVSDTYDYYNVLTSFLPEFKDKILSRNGKVVIRPDSCLKTQVELICGDPNGTTEAERKGSLQLLWEVFGGTINNKGYKVLNDKIGLIYGDGFFYERFVDVLSEMTKKGWATSNLTIGVGGILLQNHSRDEQGYALKATKATLKNGKKISLFKEPKTDTSKKSLKGYLALQKYDNGKYYTLNDVDENIERDENLLDTVFENGKLLIDYTLDDVRENFEKHFKELC